ncbi:hypothetical protein TNCV_1186211 [Trichonephila clavipes]|nr:hypothetical protein TNCV_1186211 [Trichonephila clavipes]
MGFMHHGAPAHFLIAVRITSILHIPGGGLDAEDLLLVSHAPHASVFRISYSGAISNRLCIWNVGGYILTVQIVVTSADIICTLNLFERVHRCLLCHRLLIIIPVTITCRCISDIDL